MTNSLVQQYVSTGILQFGRFQTEEGSFAPISSNFLLLPSFPQTLQQTAQALVPLLRATPADRLLATRQTTALGGVLAVESGIPLTYVYGEPQEATNAFIIEGAYDLGHPTTLLTYLLTDAADAESLLEPAQQVGLTIGDVLCLFSLGTRGIRRLAQRGVRVHALFEFQTQLDGLVEGGGLPPAMRQHILDWVASL